MIQWKWVLSLALLACAGNCLAGIYDELDASQKSALQNGQQVVITREDPSSVWPRISVYQRLESTSEEAAAVFADYGRHKNFLPDILKSEVTGSPNPRVAQVDYVVKLPWPLSDTSQTSLNQLSSYGKGGYRVDWNLTRADTAKSGTGTLRIESLGTGAVVHYSSFIVPKSSSAGLAKGKAIEMVKKSVSALAREIERLRSGERGTLDKQIEKLRAALL